MRQLTPGFKAIALGAALIASPAQAAISGVCPDGSIFIVQNARQIPCSGAKQVEPSEIPPLRPEYLPSPYTWQVWNEKHDPDNPYNALDSAQQVRRYDVPPVGGAAEGNVSTPPGVTPDAATAFARPGERAGAARIGPLDLGLSDAELRDLFTIIDLSQQRVPARLQRRTADGQGVFEVAMARSRAFEGRLQQAWQSRGGLGSQPVLLFTAHSKRAEDFWANLTFVQGHLTYQPDSANPRQLGILQGRLGALDAGEVVLGYVVLPESWDLAQALDVYWNDRHMGATFGP